MFEFKPGLTAIVVLNYYAPDTPRWPGPPTVRMGTTGQVVCSTNQTVTIKIEAWQDEPERIVTLPRLDERGHAIVEPPVDFSALRRRIQNDPWLTATFSGSYDSVIDRPRE
jgi:hypothetical protein